MHANITNKCYLVRLNTWMRQIKGRRYLSLSVTICHTNCDHLNRRVWNKSLKIRFITLIGTYPLTKKFKRHILKQMRLTKKQKEMLHACKESRKNFGNFTKKRITF